MVPAVVASVGMGGAGMAVVPVVVRTLGLPLVGDTITGARRFVRSDDDDDDGSVVALVAAAATVVAVVAVVAVVVVR